MTGSFMAAAVNVPGTKKSEVNKKKKKKNPVCGTTPRFNPSTADDLFTRNSFFVCVSVLCMRDVKNGYRP